jgi:glycosyltransferase involved in cell wall biosynthesis
MEYPKAEGGVLSTLITKFLPRAIRWRLHILRPQQVGDEGLIPELTALSTTMSSKPGLCHFIYGEDTYFFTPMWQHKNKKVVATYHYPPSRLDERVNHAVLDHLDAVILMSESQRGWFERYLPADKIHVIPHHVDTDFFMPSSRTIAVDKRFSIISVGGTLRDMKMLLEVIQHLNELVGQDSIEFNLLIPRYEREPFKDFVNVNLLDNISDEELRELYQNSSLGFMSLIDCTANNAVLEMMACGIPVACTACGGITDYLKEEGALLLHKQQTIAEIASDIKELLDRPEKRKEMGEFNRQYALNNLSLEVIANRLGAFYREISAR